MLLLNLRSLTSMEQSTRYILFVLLFTGLSGCIYFLSILFNIPLAAALVINAALLFFTYKWIVPDNTPSLFIQKKTTWLTLAIFTIGLSLITKNALNDAGKHGAWDAWAIWNFHAKYLASPEHWKLLFSNIENDHPDYPLALPSIIAFWTRIIPAQFNLIIPFTLSLLTTICGPAIIFSEFYKKSLLIASVALFLLAGNAFYIHTGMSQYADTLVGLFFLCALVCMEHALEGKKYIALSVAFLGCCIWTKNEGVILAVLFTIFYSHRLFSRQNIKHTIYGIALPMVTFVAFKITCKTPNDMVSSLGAGTWQMITDKSRYALIYASFINNLKESFPYIKGLLYFYMIMCLLGKKWPGRAMALTLSCLLVYMLIYVISQYALEWHLGTSQSRLMVQLMPALIYAMGLKFTRNSMPGNISENVFTRVG